MKTMKRDLDHLKDNYDKQDSMDRHISIDSIDEQFEFNDSIYYKESTGKALINIRALDGDDVDGSLYAD